MRELAYVAEHARHEDLDQVMKTWMNVHRRLSSTYRWPNSIQSQTHAPI